MSDSDDDDDDDDDDIIETFKVLKRKKDAEEEKLVYMEAREEFLKAVLLEPLIQTRWSTRWSNTSEQIPIKSRARSLRNSLVDILNFVKRPINPNMERPVIQHMEESLNKAVTWASCAGPEEEDTIMRKLLENSLLNSFDRVKKMEVSKTENTFKDQLVESLKEAIDCTRRGDDDDNVVEALAGCIVVASSWTKQLVPDVDERVGSGILDLTEEELDEDDLYDENDIKLARQELQQCLKETFDWVRSIHPHPRERGMHRELLDSLSITMHWCTTAASALDDEVMKQLLQETLLISLNWVMGVDEDEGEEMKHKLIELLIFAINWAASDECRGDDVVMITLLKQSFKIAVKWREA